MELENTAELKAQIHYLQAALIKSTKQTDAFETIFKHSTDGVILFQDGRLTACNQAVVKMLGYHSEKELLNMHPSQLSPEQQADGENSLEKSEKMISLAMDKGSHRFEWIHQRSDGEPFWAEVVLTKFIFDEDVTLHATWRDISRQKKLEHDVIIERDAATEANQAKSAFLAKMSHELRTPMHGILSFANMGINKFEQLAEDKKLKYFQHIKTSGDRLLHLLNDLLDLAKMEAGKMKPSFAQGNLTDIAESCIAEQQARLDSLNQHIILQAPDILPLGCFDHLRIAQVITNFLSNAMKHTDEGQQINLTIENTSLETPQGQLAKAFFFSIRDFGRGIPEGEHEKIFNAFEQSSSSVAGTGTGLGLPICREIIAFHQGKVWAENHPNGGAVFSFIIPAEHAG